MQSSALTPLETEPYYGPRAKIFQPRFYRPGWFLRCFRLHQERTGCIVCIGNGVCRLALRENRLKTFSADNSYRHPVWLVEFFYAEWFLNIFGRRAGESGSVGMFWLDCKHSWSDLSLGHALRKRDRFFRHWSFCHSYRSGRPMDGSGFLPSIFHARCLRRVHNLFFL